MTVPSRNGPGALNEFIVLTGLDRLGTGPNPSSDEETFLALEMFAKHYGALEGWAVRETAKQCAIQRLKDVGFPRPWEIVRRAVEESNSIQFLCNTKDGDVPNRIEPRPIADLLADPDLEKEPVWVFDGYAARGEVTLLSGPPKAGKTTLLGDLAVHVAAGFGFLGRRVTQASVLWLDLEMHPRRTAKLFRTLQAEDLPIHVYSGRRPSFDLADYITEHGIGLLIIDSLSKYWTIEDENDAVQTTRALEELRGLAEATDCAIVLIYHVRKSGGEDGLDTRGSGAITAVVDVAISFKRDRYGENRRILDTISRDESTPRKLVVEYADGSYRALGTASEVRDRTQRAQLLEAVTAEPQTHGELAEASELGLRQVKRVAKALYEEGILNRDGTGKRGSPFRFSRKDTPVFDSGHQNPMPGTGTETEKAG